jgi:large repetitive protein
MSSKIQNIAIAILFLLTFAATFICTGCATNSSSTDNSGSSAPAFATTSTGVLAVAGYQHNAQILDNGKVFVTYGIGGVHGSVYDPVIGVFTPTTGTAAVTRSCTSGITKLADGRVLISGFGQGMGMIDPPEIYDPATGLYSGTAQLPISRCSPSTVLLPSGDVFMGSGDHVGTGVNLVFSPTANTWTFTASQDPGKFRMAGTYAPVLYLSSVGKVFIMGGLGLPNSNVIALYNPAGDTFALPAHPTYVQRKNASGTVLADGKVLIVGGQDGASDYLVSAEIYNPISDTFSLTTGYLNTARTKHRATLLQNGKVLISGGLGTAGTALASLELYDPASKTFSNAGIMRTPRVDHCTVLLNDGRVLIMGGQDNNGTKLASCEIYTP